jgi:hypothetical protein
LDTAVDQVLGAERTQPLLSATLRSPMATEALVRAQQDAKNFLATLDARGLHELINGGAQAPTEQWLAKANAFLADVQAGRVGVTVQTLADAQMLGALGAFAAQGPAAGRCRQHPGRAGHARGTGPLDRCAAQPRAGQRR